MAETATVEILLKNNEKLRSDLEKSTKALEGFAKVAAKLGKKKISIDVSGLDKVQKEFDETAEASRKLSAEGKRLEREFIGALRKLKKESAKLGFDPISKSAQRLRANVAQAGKAFVDFSRGAGKSLREVGLDTRKVEEATKRAEKEWRNFSREGRKVAKVAREVAAAEKAAAAAAKQLAADQRAASAAAKRLEADERRLAAAADRAAAAKRRAAAAALRLAAADERARKSARGLLSAFRGVRAGLAALGIAAVARRMTRLVSEAIRVKRSFDGIEQTLKAVTDTTEEYDRAQRLVFNTAKRLGLQITSLGTDYANFLASTKELDLSQRQIEKIFIQVSEAARVLNLPVDRVKLTFLALSQTASKGIACVDTETEILALRGWLRWDQLHRGEIVAGINLETGELEWQVLTEVWEFGYEGDMVAVEHAGESLSMIPAHRVIVWEEGRLAIKRAAYLDGSETWALVAPKGDQLPGILPPATVGKAGNLYGKGRVWCPETPLGTWIARKGDWSFCTGNTMEELRRQLGDQLPGILPRLAKELNLTTAALFEMIRSGRLLAEEALPAIGRAAEGLAGGQVLEASQQLAANIDRLGTAAQLTQKRVIELAEPALNKLIKALTSAAESSPDLERSLANIIEGLASLGETAVVLGPGLIKFVSALSEMGRAVQIIVLTLQLAKEEGFNFLVSLFGEEADFKRVVLLAEETADSIETINKRLLEAQKANVEEAVELFEDETKQREKIAKISADALFKIAQKLGKDLEKISKGSAERTLEIEKLTADEREEILRELTAVLALIEIESAQDRAGAGDQIVAVARGIADLRLKTNEALAERLAALELEVASDFQAAADQILASARISAGDREKLAQDLSQRLLKIEQERIEKVEDAREAFETKLREGGNREDAERELSDKVVEIFEDETRKKIDELERFDKAVEKSVDKQIKLDQKLLAVRLKSLAKLREEATKVFKDLEDLSFGGGGDEAATKLQRLKKELEALEAKPRFDLTGAERRRIQELPAEIRKAGVELQRVASDADLAKAGIKGLGIEMAQFSKKALEDVQGLVVSNKDFANSFDALGEQSKIALGNALRQFEELGKANRLTDADVRGLQGTFEALGLSGKDSIGGIASALDNLSGKSTPAQQIATDLTGVGEKAAAARPLVEGLAAQVERVGSEDQAAKIRGIAASFATLSKALEDEGEGFEQLNVLATALVKIAGPLETISINLPLLPPPVAAIVASVIELVEAKALEPLTTALLAIEPPVKLLAENLPLVSLAVADLVTAAADSKEPIGDLQEALETLGSPEVVQKLTAAATALGILQTALEKLASAEGFGAVRTAAESLATYLGGEFEVAILEAANLIVGEIANAFLLLARTIAAAKTKALELAGVLGTKLPDAAERGAKRAIESLQSIGAEVDIILGKVGQLIQAFDTLEQKRKAAG